MVIASIKRALCWIVCFSAAVIPVRADTLSLPPACSSSQCALKVTEQKEIAQQETSINEPATTAPEKYVIPFLYDRLQTPTPIVQVSINGHPPLPFLLDTGATQHVLTPQAAKTLNVHPAQQTFVANTKIKTFIVHVDTISMATVDSLRHKPFSILNAKTVLAHILNFPIQPGEIPCAGIIGMNIFRKMTVQLDFEKKIFTLFVSPPPLKLLSGATNLPLKVVQTWFFGVTLKADEQHPYDFLLDTGCEVTQLPAHESHLFDIHETPYDIHPSSILGIENHHLGLLPALHLGELLSENVAVTYPQNEKEKLDLIVGKGDAILGMNVLCRYIVTIDFPNCQLYLQPAANYKEMAQLQPFSAVRVVRKGADTQIAEVLPGSAPARAGLLKGDLVLKVDKKPVQGLPAWRQQHIVDGWGDTEAILEVQRQGESKLITYHRYSIAVVAEKVNKGLSMHFALPARLLVDNSLKAFPAYLAGIRKGDEILAVGALSVEKTDYERLLQAICSPETNPLALTIQRKGEAQPRQVMVKW